MKSRITGLGILLALTACEPTAPKPAQPPVPADNAGNPEWMGEWRQPELARFHQYPGIAQRRGDVLTVNVNGKPVASFTDIDKLECEGNNTCSLWQFVGTLTLQTSPGKDEVFIVVAHNNGEILHHLLIDAGGQTHWIGDIYTVSPDRRFLAVGEQENILSSGSFAVVSITGPDQRWTADFDAQCSPETWESKTVVEVVCSRDDEGSVEVAAVAEEITPGTWQLREYAIRKNQNDMVVTLRSETAPMKQVSVQDKAKADAYERAQGFQRLTD